MGNRTRQGMNMVLGQGGEAQLLASVRRILSLECGIQLEMEHGFPGRRLMARGTMNRASGSWKG